MPRFELDATKELRTGLHPSLTDADVPFWKTGENVIFTPAGVRPVRGQMAALRKLSSSPVFGAAMQSVGTSRRLFWGSTSALYLYEVTLGGATGPLDVSRTGGYSAGSRWSFAPFGSWMIAVNGIDPPQAYKGGPTFVDLGGSPPVAEIVRVHAEHVILFNTSNGESRIEWSDAGDAETWTPAGTNTAGYIELQNFGPIVTVAQLGDFLAVYGEDRMALLQFIGAPFIFGTKMALTTGGAVSKYAVAEVGSLNYVFGRHGIYRTDGSQIEYIDRPSVHDFVYGDLNTAQLANVVAWHNVSNKIVVFFYPRKGETYPNRAVAFHYDLGVWSVFEYGRTAAVELGVFDVPFLFDDRGNIWQESSEEIAAPLAPVPFLLTDRATIHVGYGVGGYGAGGYGGDFGDI